MRFLHINRAFLAVFVSTKGQYYLRDANASAARGSALAVRFRSRRALTFPPGEGFFVLCPMLNLTSSVESDPQLRPMLLDDSLS